jgi:histidine triad (HIT) family protein
MLTDEQAESLKEQLRKQVEKLPEEQKAEWSDWIEKASNEQIEELLKQQQSQQGEGGECLFCEIGKGAVDTFRIYEDAGIIAFLDINPSVAGQAIIIPKEHFQFIFQIPDQLLWDIIRIVKLITPFIVNVTKSQGLNIYIPQGPTAGQRINHFAINLIPRFENDKAVFAWDRKEVAKEDLEKAAKEIRIMIEKNLAEEKSKIEKKLREEGSMKKDADQQKIHEFPRRMP